MVLSVLVVMLQKSKIEVDCNTVHIFALVKSAGAVKQKSRSEVKTKSETGERREIFSLDPHGHVRLARFARESHACSLANQFLGKQGSCFAA